jgi:vacuole morphology and inheritance protein 14
LYVSKSNKKKKINETNLLISDLRLQLLESNRHPYLLKCLCGLMMLLPQGKAFNTLKERLNNVNTLVDNANESSILFGKKTVNVIDKKKMIQIFYQAQNKMTSYARKKKETEKKI